MEKKYRLSIEITCKIKDRIQGNPDQNEIEYCTGEIVKGLLANPDLLLEYYSSLAVQYWLPDELRKSEWEKILTIETQAWVKLVARVPPRVGVYLEEIIKEGNSERDECGNFIVDSKWNRIFDRVSKMVFTGWNFEEIKA